jgi:hypothetical protein
MASPLETIVRDARIAFVIAKSDGKLDAAEVVQIAVQVSQKIYALSSLSPAEKDAMVLLCLKKGLSAANGLQGLSALAQLSPAALAVAEEQILSAGMAAVSACRAAAPKLFAPVKNWLAHFPFCSDFVKAATALLPKDTALVQEALQAVPSSVVSILEPVVESDAKVEPVAEPVQVVVENTVQLNVPEVEPSPEASS